MFQDQFASRRVSAMRTLVHESCAGQLIAGLMGSRTATFFYDHVICKTPSAPSEATIPWHQVPLAPMPPFQRLLAATDCPPTVV